MSGCIFNFSTNNCRNIYIGKEISSTQYKIIKKTLKIVNNRYKYVKSKINGKNSVVILQTNYTDFYNTRLLADQTYYNRSIPKEPDIST